MVCGLGFGLGWDWIGLGGDGGKLAFVLVGTVGWAEFAAKCFEVRLRYWRLQFSVLERLLVVLCCYSCSSL